MAEPLPEFDDFKSPLELGPQPGRGSGARVWLARHAQVHEDWAGRAYGSQDVPLSEAGLARTEVLGASLAALPPTSVLASDLDRAARLGRAVAERAQAPLRFDAGLREVDRGAWQSCTVSDLRDHRAGELSEFYADPWTYRGHGGESDSDVARRAWPLLANALRDGGARPVLAAHYNVLRCLIAVALGLDPRRSFSLRLETGRAALLEDGPAGFRLLALNLADPGAFVEADEHLTIAPAGS